MKLDFCAICGTKDDLHHHHIILKSQGGGDEETNILTVCAEHHAWIHSIRPGAWNNNGNVISASMLEARDLGFKLGRPTSTTEETVSKVLELRKSGKPIKKIAKELKIGIGTIYKIMETPESFLEQIKFRSEHGDKTYREYKDELRKDEREAEKKLAALERSEKKERKIREQIKEKQKRKIDKEAEKIEDWFDKESEKLKDRLNNKIDPWFKKEEEKFMDNMNKRCASFLEEEEEKFTTNIDKMNKRCASFLEAMIIEEEKLVTKFYKKVERLDEIKNESRII